MNKVKTAATTLKEWEDQPGYQALVTNEDECVEIFRELGYGEFAETTPQKGFPCAQVDLTQKNHWIVLLNYIELDETDRRLVVSAIPKSLVPLPEVIEHTTMALQGSDI